MSDKYLGREESPFGDEIWERLDQVVISAARAQLSARKLLDIEGPYGFGLKSVPLADRVVSDTGARVITADVLTIPLIETMFTLGARDLAAFEQTGFALDTSPVAEAAIAAAAAEDALIFEGHKDLGLSGIMTVKGAQSVTLGKWDEIGTAANDVIKAVSALDAAGFHGPYLLALAPGLYNMLYRLYPQGYQVELQHVESIVGSSVIKAPGIKKGGVLLASGKQFASIVIGQDMATGFIGPEDSDYKFKISESLAPRIRVPAAICVLKA
ncbi:MAG: bacteriocin family protein [Armatimonadetes bacterium]|nr:bacteriocin family protein [Armatimonadota bacterium]